MKRLRAETGAALLEAAISIPILLLIAVGIFEFGRAYQTWQVLTNAAREGARICVVPSPTPGLAESQVRQYMQLGQLPNYATATVTVDRNVSLTVSGETVTASRVTIDYPFDFTVLQPAMKLVYSKSMVGNSLTMHASALMRNEAQ